MPGDYLREHVEVSCASPRRQRTCAANLRAFFDTYSATDVDIAACRRYVAHRQAAGVADATIRREMSALSAALRPAVKWKRLAPNDLPTIEKPDDVQANTLGLPRWQLMGMQDPVTPAWAPLNRTASFPASPQRAP